MNQKPTILLDVDGVLNPCPFGHMPVDWVFEPTRRSSPESGGWELNLSREMGAALMNLGCEIQWLTTWIKGRDFANVDIGPALGWSRLPGCSAFENRMSDYYWKVEAVKRFLAEPGSKVVWIDDDADSMVRQFESLDNLDPHGRLLVICPESDVGLTRAHVTQIKEFLMAEPTEPVTALATGVVTPQPNAVQRCLRAVAYVPLIPLAVGCVALDGELTEKPRWSTFAEDSDEFFDLLTSYLILPLTLPVAVLRLVLHQRVRDFLFGPGPM